MRIGLFCLVWLAGAFQIAVDNLKKVQDAKPRKSKPD
jgi:hypothetical protein